MICVNASTDSNDSAISYSPPSLSESPVKSLAIQQLLQSPILNHGSQSRINYDSDSDVDVNDNSNDNSNDMMTAATLDTTPDGSQTDPTSATDLPMDVSSSESSDRPNNPEPIAVTPNGGRNTFRRQASVCLNTKIASSPRALAILKNAIKTSLTPNSICDKSEVKSDISKSVSDLSAVKGTHSPPNKSFKSSPLSRGSALLKAAKERLERQESQRSPKISCNLFQMSNESSLDRQLTSILRKRELQSSPTNTDHKAKKKKVLFAEPVVSSQMEFRPSPCHSSLSSDYLTLHPDPATDKEVEELTNQNNDKKRNNLVHQHSTFDKEFDDIAYDFGGHNSPLLFTQDILDEEPVVVPSCEPSLELEPLVDEERLLSSPELLQVKHSEMTNSLI